MRFAVVPLALTLLFAAATSAGDARRQQDTSQCRPSTILAARVATIEQPTLSVEQNQFFVISLGSNPSTGYHWIVGQSKPYPFGVVGTTIREGVPMSGAQPQYDQYGRPYGQAQQARGYGQPGPTVGVGAEQILILKATPPAGVETIEMRYVPANVTSLDGRRSRDPAPGEVVRQFTIQITPPPGC